MPMQQGQYVGNLYVVSHGQNHRHGLPVWCSCTQLPIISGSGSPWHDIMITEHANIYHQPSDLLCQPWMRLSLSRMSYAKASES